MGKISQEELAEILRKHQMWLNDEEGGEKADLSYADLNDADLNDADLSGADLNDADLSGADLRYINTSSISGLNIISVQINTSRKNNMISYWKELDIVTTGCFQGTLEELKKQIQKTHKDSDKIRNRYEKAIEFIEYMANDYDKEN